MNRYLKIVGIFLIMGICSCQQSKPSKEIVSPPKKIEGYTIIKEDSNPALSKSVIVVRLEKEVNKEELTAIAKDIKSKRSNFSKLWISYLLPGMKDGTGSWASTHFTPNLEVKITGATKSATDEMVKKPVSGDILGTWIDNDPILPNVTYLVKENGKTYIKAIYAKTQYANASEQIKEVSKSSKNGLVKYTYKNTHGEFYLFEKNGNLSLYDSEGKFKELRKK